MSTISFIVPTIGRYSLQRTIASIECRPGDEILLVASEVPTDMNYSPFLRFIQCPRGNDWGHTERNYATQFAKGEYLAHIDDDDWYAEGTRELMADAIRKTPNRPVLFRMQFPNGITLWQDEELRCGNVGTPMILIPNKPEKLGLFRPFVGGDCAYLEEMKWDRKEIVWRPEIVALLGHNT